MACKSSAGASTFKKILETGCLVTTWLALGLYLEIYGPTQKDLIIITNSDYEKVAVATTGRSIGLFPGCILGGYLVDKFGTYCHLIIALCLDGAAIITFIIPWTTDVNALWVLCFIGGTVEAAINVAGQKRILNIWLEKSAAPMILLHMGYGIGSFLVPLYSNPFLAIPHTGLHTNSSVLNQTMISTQDGMVSTRRSSMSTTEATSIPDIYNETSSVPPRYLRPTQIQYPYTISAVCVALMSLVFFVYQVFENRRVNKAERSMDGKSNALQQQKADVNETKRTMKQMINPATCAGGRFWYGIQLFAFLFFYMGNAGGGERMAAGFVRSYSIDQLGFSMDEGSFINTTFWISFTVGRLVFFLLARWISIRVLVVIENTGLLITGILMSIFARNSSTAYWVLTQPMGLFIAPLWPSGMAWMDFHAELTGIGMAIFLLGGSLGGFTHMRIIGYLYEHVGYETYMYQVLGYGLIGFVLSVILTIVGAQHGSRFAPQTNKEIPEEVKMLEDGINLDKSPTEHNGTLKENEKVLQTSQ